MSNAQRLLGPAGEDFLGRVAEGEGTKKVLSAMGFVAMDLFQACEYSPEFSARYQRAREIALRMRVESLLTLQDDHPDVDVARLRLQSENTRWIAERTLRREYGASVQHEHTHTLELGPMLRDAQARRAALYAPDRSVFDQQLIEDAQIVDSTEDSDAAPTDKQSKPELVYPAPRQVGEIRMHPLPGLDDLLG